MLYSTYMYMFRALEGTDYEVETVPGIPAFLGIASHIGMPVAEWEETVLILPATADAEKIDKALAAADHAVIMKVYKTGRTSRKNCGSITSLKMRSWYPARSPG